MSELAVQRDKWRYDYFTVDADDTLNGTSARAALFDVAQPAAFAERMRDPGFRQRYHEACEIEPPIEHNVAVAELLAVDWRPVVVTNRSEQAHAETVRWLRRHAGSLAAWVRERELPDWPLAERHLVMGPTDRLPDPVRAKVDRVLAVVAARAATGGRHWLHIDDQLPVLDRLREHGICGLHAIGGAVAR